MKQLEKALEQLNIFEGRPKAQEEALKKFKAYMDGVLLWNEKINLTSITSEEDFVKKHFVDSILCAGQTEVIAAQRVIDVGTGGGFPGVPLAIIYPEKEFVVMDSLNKRIKVISELCEQININNVTAIHGRAEELAKANSMHREVFDLCVSRAVANMSTLSEYCLPFVRPGGTFIAYKGPEYQAELQSAENAIGILGGSVSRAEAVCLEGFDLEHTLIYIQKKKKTPSKYPRKAGTPSKTPLK